MADDVSIGELRRRLDAHEDRAHESLDARVTDLAAHTVPLGEYQTAEKARDQELQRMQREHDEDIREVRSEMKESVRQIRTDLKELRERPQMTLGRWAVVATAVIALLALVVQAYGTLKGAK